MNHIVIVGSGPVGSFMAVLCRCIGFQVTVFEKRETFTRNINLKIDSDLFKKTRDVISRLNVESDFFAKFYDFLKSQKNRILIKEMEEKFTEEAKILGAKYVTKDVKSFWELYLQQRNSNPVILDCTGRNSNLRRDVFGSDEVNIVSTPLQYAMYINFKAIVSNSTSLYQVMKNVPNIKLTEVVVSKNKDEDGFTNVTIPVFITKELARRFDEEHPDINKNPLNPFNSSKIVSDAIFLPVSAVISNLLVDNCCIDLNSVKVKKIVISSGYAKNRSQINFICLGDSAAHLAFFRSLNVGLKHALELFIHFSTFSKDNAQPVDSNEVMRQFKDNNPHLNPVRVFPTQARNVFFVITKVLWYGCFTFCTTNQKTTRLTDFTGRTEKEIYLLLPKYNQKLSKWEESLKDFEQKREDDIQNEIDSNKLKNISYELVSAFIDINSLSILKVSEVIRAMKGQQSLFKNDFQFFLMCFKIRRLVLISNTGSKSEVTVSVICKLLELIEKNKSPVLEEVKRFCFNSKLSSAEKLKLITYTINNKFAETKQTLETEIVGKTIGLWPKLVGLRFDGSNVRLNIVLTIIRNELRTIDRLHSDSKDAAEMTNAAGTSYTSEFQRPKTKSKALGRSNENLLLDGGRPVFGILQGVLRKSGRFNSQPNLLQSSGSDDVYPLITFDCEDI